MNSATFEETPSAQRTESEEAIIEQILSNAKSGEPSERFPGSEMTVLECGSKRLLLAINRRAHSIGTFVENVRPEEGREPHETSALYRAARRLMQRVADTDKVPYEYKILTENEKMGNWAEITGNSIFKWELCDSIPQEGLPPLRVFKTNVLPASK
jgi:hypothetical protein